MSAVYSPVYTVYSPVYTGVRWALLGWLPWGIYV